MKRRLIFYTILVNPIFMIGQSVYMHEAQEESGNLFDAIIGFIIFFGIIYLINKVIESNKQNRTIKDERNRKITIADGIANKKLESNNSISKYQNKDSWQKGFKRAEYDKLRNCVKNFGNITIEDLIKKYRQICEEGHIIQAEKIMEDIGYYQNIFLNTKENPKDTVTNRLIKDPELSKTKNPDIVLNNVSVLDKINAINNKEDDIIFPQSTGNVLNKKEAINLNHSNSCIKKEKDEIILTNAVPIDLGLSVLWSDCNVGAQKPEEYGRYFAWGEIKNSESWSYRRCYNSERMSLKVLQRNQNKYFCSISGLAIYDAASYNMGEGWRLPTKEELEELIQQCSWERTVFNGIKGIRLTSKNENSIFLPCAGHWIVENPAWVGEEVIIWSGSPYIRENYDSIREAYYLQFSTISIFGDGPKLLTTQCTIPFSIRAVKDKKQ